MPLFKEKEKGGSSFLFPPSLHRLLFRKLNLKAPLAVVRHGLQKTFILDEVEEEDEESWDFVGSGDSGQFLVSSWNGE